MMKQDQEEQEAANKRKDRKSITIEWAGGRGEREVGELIKNVKS